MTPGVLGGTLEANYDFTGGHTRNNTELKGQKLRRYTKTKTDGTFDALKLELHTFKDEKRPSLQ